MRKDNGGQAGQEAVGQAAEFGRRQSEQVRSLAEASTRMYGDMASDSRQDVTAMVETGTRLAKGVQDMGWEMLQFSQNSLRLSLKTANDLMACRSVEDVMEIQREFLRESMDNLMQESARILDMSNSVTTEAVSKMQPPAMRGGH